MFIKTFKEISKNDVNIAGGKGASLGEMTNTGIPVPPGFVVLAVAFDKFLEETDMNVEIQACLDRVNHQDVNSVEHASKKIRDLIGDAEFPKDLGKLILKEFNKFGAKSLAVRSSATAEDSSVASWAGELESYLNIDKKNLLTSVKECWSSLFTPRAIFYRFEKKLHKTNVSVAVVVQKMVKSEVSGICFTVHPVTEDKRQMVIEAGWGLGEAIVGGKITPDTYVLDKPKTKNQKPKILDKNISEQKMMIVRGTKGTVEAKVPKAKQNIQKLSDQHILELAKICLGIEKHYKFPQDIEWALEKNKFYITQSRPITTL
jgi:pyruvate,water dikinase